jgi:4a-hydroxytetrahydrobiopterin dehydratase
MLLKDQKCGPCHSNEPPLSTSQALEHLKDLDGWRIVTLQGTPQLEKAFSFPTYLKGLDFARAVAEIAEEVDHHPIMEIGWREVRVKWWTHNINGLHLNDFIMAARCDDLTT